jgi:hypothetical protein
LTSEHRANSRGGQHSPAKHLSHASPPVYKKAA